MQILPTRALHGLRRNGRGFAGLQGLARRTGPCHGSIDAKEHLTVQTRRLGLFTEYDLLRDCGAIIFSLRAFSAAVAWLAGTRLFDDRTGIALGGIGELFGEQEI